MQPRCDHTNAYKPRLAAGKGLQCRLYRRHYISTSSGGQLLFHRLLMRTRTQGIIQCAFTTKPCCSEFSAYSLLAPRGIFRLLLRVFQAARHGFTLSLSLHLQEALIVIFFFLHCEETGTILMSLK